MGKEGTAAGWLPSQILPKFGPADGDQQEIVKLARDEDRFVLKRLMTCSFVPLVRLGDKPLPKPDVEPPDIR